MSENNQEDYTQKALLHDLVDIEQEVIHLCDLIENAAKCGATIERAVSLGREFTSRMIMNKGRGFAGICRKIKESNVKSAKEHGNEHIQDKAVDLPAIG